MQNNKQQTEKMRSNSDNNIIKIPEPTLRRLPWYLSNIKLMKEQGGHFVSSTQLSKATGIDASQIAKDLSYIKVSGKPRVGYEATYIIKALEDFLGFTRQHEAFLFGVGNLGGALLNDNGLSQFGLKIVGAFDVRKEIIGTEINGIPIYDINRLPDVNTGARIKIGILTVPIYFAQNVTDWMVACGIKAVWNFTPFRIRVPENIVVQNTSLYAHLAVMFNRLNEEELKR